MNAPCSFPHTRGGGPQVLEAAHRVKEVFPTRVGVDRIMGEAEQQWHGFPHTRGGGPFLRLE